ncbi:MAG: hypothetical protein ACK5LK_11995, partial [Chthoniobacterales bacterium]
YNADTRFIFSASWVTFQELEDFNWEQIIQRTALVEKEKAVYYEGNPLGGPQKDGKPLDYVSYFESAVGIDVARVRWRESYRKAACWDSVREDLSIYHSAENRLVFWFDA